ncbi:SDR family oxidoreductase [Desulfococcus sp.]|uniref:SDR family oxidoreductase n=1 Tax=Desulfococcus sp. TaxID=2025834 RepID=UPI0035932194
MAFSSEFNFSRALITGGAGFIGSHIADVLVRAGRQVRVIDNLASGSLDNLAHLGDRVDFIHGDIRDADLLLRAARGCEVIFHEAAVVSVTRTVAAPVETAAVNDMGTLQVLDTARKAGVRRVVLASSSAVYGDDPVMPKREEMRPKPMSPYAVQKLTNEHYARLYHELYGIETVCLRYFNVYGPRQDPSSPYSGVISIFMTRAFTGEPPVVYGDGEQCRDFVFVEDVARANLLAGVAPDISGGVFNVGTGTAMTVNDLWLSIARRAGIDAAPVYAPSRPGDIRESLSSIDRAEAELGFRPAYDFERGIDITMAWYRDRAERKST